MNISSEPDEDFFEEYNDLADLSEAIESEADQDAWNDLRDELFEDA
jgi:hypothetical protein